MFTSEVDVSRVVSLYFRTGKGTALVVRGVGDVFYGEERAWACV